MVPGLRGVVLVAVAIALDHPGDRTAREFRQRHLVGGGVQLFRHCDAGSQIVGQAGQLVAAAMPIPSLAAGTVTPAFDVA